MTGINHSQNMLYNACRWIKPSHSDVKKLNWETSMRAMKLALASAFIAAGLLSFGSLATGSSADAATATKSMKPAPGKCGAGMFYSMKTKKCAVPAPKV